MTKTKKLIKTFALLLVLPLTFIFVGRIGSSAHTHNWGNPVEKIYDTYSCKLYSCDCGITKEKDITQTEEQMYNVSQKVFAKYLNGQKSFTYRTVADGYTGAKTYSFSYNSITYEIAGPGICTESGRTTKVVKSGNMYIRYYINVERLSEYVNINDIIGIINKALDCEYSAYVKIEIENYNSNKISIEKIGNIYSMTKDNYLIKYDENSIKSITFSNGQISSTTTFEDCFDANLFNSIDVTYYTQPS